ncbi:hypothetical protein [Leisingera sp. NJS201]
MSTEHQRYSTENQADAIRRYAMTFDVPPAVPSLMTRVCGFVL